MSLLDDINGSDLFATANQNSGQLQIYASSALNQGIEHYMQGNYDSAAKAFKRSVGLFQDSPYAIDAAQYLADAYLKLDDTEGAIKAYQSAIRMDPFRDDSHIKLGNLYFSEKRYADAAQVYRQAVRVKPSTANYYSLGQAYLHLEQYGDAEDQFNQVLHLEPDRPSGNYGLGLTYSRQGRFEDAVQQFKAAIELDDQFYGAYADLGYTYADMGEMDQAQAQVDFLDIVAPELADTLSRYMYRVDSPKIQFALGTSTFLATLPNRTPVADLDSYLENAGATKTLTMVLQFDKAMDRESVENRLNWTIGRSEGFGPGRAYNYGLPLPDTEVQVYPHPTHITYDQTNMTATVFFEIQQNATADGTIDPSHIEFKFSGKDQDGNRVDPDFDQYSGFSGSY